MRELSTGFWILVLASIFLIMAGTIKELSNARAHDWYDRWCCNDRDCAPAEVEALPGGYLKATTKHGTAIFAPSMTRRPSRDGRWHACIQQYAPTPELKARCIYAPAGA